MPISRKLKIDCPSEQDPYSPIDNPSYPEASTSLLSLSVRGKTERNTSWDQASNIEEKGRPGRGRTGEVGTVTFQRALCKQTNRFQDIAAQTKGETSRHP